MYRILVEHLDKYRHQSKDVSRHISHKYSKEMSSRSVVVSLTIKKKRCLYCLYVGSLGIICKNENVVDQMCTIMDQLQTYAPAVQSTKQLSLLEDGVVELDDVDFHRLLIGGDQLTVARCRGSAAVRSDHSTSTECLRGLTPVSEDWHAKRSYLIVCHFVI